MPKLKRFEALALNESLSFPLGEDLVFVGKSAPKHDNFLAITVSHFKNRFNFNKEGKIYHYLFYFYLKAGVVTIMRNIRTRGLNEDVISDDERALLEKILEAL